MPPCSRLLQSETGSQQNSPMMPYIMLPSSALTAALTAPALICLRLVPAQGLRFSKALCVLHHHRKQVAGECGLVHADGFRV